MRLRFHHMALPCTDLEASRRFYRDLVGLTEYEKPGRASEGAWFHVSDLQELHLIHGNNGATYRGNKLLDNDDVHFAFAVDDFAALLERLKANGYREDIGLHDAHSVLYRKVLDFSQIYIFDPDRHLIEFNSKF